MERRGGNDRGTGRGRRRREDRGRAGGGGCGGGGVVGGCGRDLREGFGDGEVFRCGGWWRGEGEEK